MPIFLTSRPSAETARGIVRDVSEEGEAPQRALGIAAKSFSTWGPKSVPRVDYERIFVLNADSNLVGEYVLNDESPLEFGDLKGSIPVSGMRHLVSFYQGEYAFTPFKVDNLWFVVLTRGVPRIEERGHTGTLLAAARIHIPAAIDPSFGQREAELQQKEQELRTREVALLRREEQVDQIDQEQNVTSTRLKEFETEIRIRETKVKALRDYAVQMQNAFVSKKKGPQDHVAEGSPGADLSVTQQ